MKCRLRRQIRQFATKNFGLSGSRETRASRRISIRGYSLNHPNQFEL